MTQTDNAFSAGADFISLAASPPPQPPPQPHRSFPLPSKPAAYQAPGNAAAGPSRLPSDTRPTATIDSNTRTAPPEPYGLRTALFSQPNGRAALRPSDEAIAAALQAAADARKQAAREAKEREHEHGAAAGGAKTRKELNRERDARQRAEGKRKRAEKAKRLNKEKEEVKRKQQAESKQGKGMAREKSKGKGKGKGKGKESNKGTAQDQANGKQAKQKVIENGKDKGKGKSKSDPGAHKPFGRGSSDGVAPWADMVEWDECSDPAEMLNAEIDAYYRYVSPTRSEYEVRLYLIELITRAVLKSWPDAEITPFGSWQTQLYLPQGDIDLVVSTKRFNEANKARLLGELARAMRMAQITDVVAIISKARVPIIKFVTLQGKINVDISLNQTNGISAGQIINQYLDALPGSRQMILVVKAFLSQRSMNEVYTGGLGSYAVICLVISFLQIHPKLRRGEIDAEDNLGTLLIEFFELYGRNFNYDEVGISIRQGGGYFHKKSRGWYRGGQPFLLSIEDPQDRDNDISSGSFGIRQVRNTLAGAYEMLQARLFQRAEQISGRRSGRYENGWMPEDMSILSGIMVISQETRKHRLELNRLHEQGKLQALLSIPPGADLADYVQHYRPQQDIGRKRRSGRVDREAEEEEDYVNGAEGGEGPVPLASRTHGRRDAGVGAVMLDDDDTVDLAGYTDSDADDAVGAEAADSNESDADSDDDSDGEDEEEEEDADHNDVSNPDSSSDSSVIEIISPPRPAAVTLAEPGSSSRKRKLNPRLESVSHDSFSDDYDSAERIMSGVMDGANGEDESRYASVVRPKRPRRTDGANLGAGVGDADDVDELGSTDDENALPQHSSSGQRRGEESSDDSSIIALDAPPVAEPSSLSRTAPQRPPHVANGSTVGASPGKSTGGGVSVKARREFWAGKAAAAGKAEDDWEEDAFQSGRDYVALM